MSERGTYGQSSAAKTSWWKIAIGVAVVGGIGYVVTRPMVKRMALLQRDLHGRGRAVGLEAGMTKAEQDAAWDAYYAKAGLKLTPQGDLVKADH